ncbi:MAG: ATP-dependent helicase HrpB [bacterium]
MNGLPIFEIEPALVRACAGDNTRLIIQAPTGSGKSTQIPQMLLDRGLVPAGQQIVILQPRRLAARLLATRVASERQSAIGREVGYQVRFENRISTESRIVFVTEGILLRRLVSDPELSGVGAIIFDEFHERHLFGDITLARALQLQKTLRPDLRLIVMSATLDKTALEQFLTPCTVLRSEGRMYPVRIEYLPKPVDSTRIPVWETAASETARLLVQERAGDILVFMPGSYEIHRTIQALNARPETRGCAICPLHGELAPRDQDAAVAPGDRRKIIVSTNVAETSLTIEGVRLVVDGGLARVARFDPYRGIDTLWIEKISQASADQRAGRAGRMAPGVCVRLWTEREHSERPPREIPEIRRVDLAETLLMLKASGCPDGKIFPWFEPPEIRTLTRAETLLRDLGAADEKTGDITEVGRGMLAFPLHPRYARMLLAAERVGRVRSVALIAAMTQERGLLIKRADSHVEEQRDRRLGDEVLSDFFLLMRAWSEAEAHDYNVEYCRGLGIHAGVARQAGRLYEMFCRIAEGQGLSLEPEILADDAVRRCVLAGFADQVARRLDGGTLRCEIVHGRRGVLERASVVRKSAFVVAAEVREVESGFSKKPAPVGAKGDMDVLLSLVTAIEPEWLEELFPGSVREESRVRFDDSRRVIAERGRFYHDLVLEMKRGGNPEEGEAASLLADEVQAGRCALKHWTDEVDQWLLRVSLLRKWCPELELPEIGAEDRRLMVEEICKGAFSVKEVKERPVFPVVKSWLDGRKQSLLDKHVPERLDLPGGRKVKVVYSESNPPTIAARIQDLYGVEGSIRMAMGRQLVTIQVLAPNYRPVQVTSDLTTFWREGYPKAKKELQRKYPKHKWV